MAIQPIPVTFHIRPEFRPELIVARRRRMARPYSGVLSSVIALSALALGMAYFAIKSGLSGGARTFHLAASAPAQTPPAQSSSPTPRLQAASTPAREPARDKPVEGVDYTSVSSIPAGAPARRASGGFAPLERAPDYAGFAVTAGR